MATVAHPFYRFLIILIVMALTLAGLVVRDSNPDATHAQSADDQIVFTSDRSGSEELWIMDADGSNAHQLTDTGANNVSGSWSPDRQHIVFTSNITGYFEVYTINVDGTNLQPLTDLRSWVTMPSFSPDGQHIAFASDHEGERSIYVVMPMAKICGVLHQWIIGITARRGHPMAHGLCLSLGKGMLPIYM